MRVVCGQSWPSICVWVLLLLEGTPAESYRTPYDQHQGQVHDQHRDQGHDQHQGQGHDQHRDQGHDQHRDQGHDQHRDQGHDQHRDQGHDQHRDQGHDQNRDWELEQNQDWERERELVRTDPRAFERNDRECRRCCDPGEEPPPQYAHPPSTQQHPPSTQQHPSSTQQHPSSTQQHPPSPQQHPQYRVVPQINITILKGEKGDAGERGAYGKSGKSGHVGSRGPGGTKGTKGSMGPPGEACKSYYAAFSVGRKKALHSDDYYQTMVFDTELVNLYGHFNMFTGKFYCYVPGIYYFSLNVHTWNQKETYLHVMHNEREVVILYAQPSDRSIMQSQSLMLQLEAEDQVWIRLYKGERENAIFSDDFDTYITFNGHLIKAKSEV